ncbi:2',5' RNA ligase family [Anatilimnocola aggregata]|uniref:RNA 2',3'-cyclic phosphodiesterase n=1 Tax=Anatilimnocola aggregata TaxID=2528021 RepID=A0A517YAY6_9BACT|nr:RNA 2',3'-cyclic phosphodiesterase [Anatilimnocola aggregata]QDU27407.1 2',5' RNA ligase family [Anatilimnocola aggregata]
MQRIRSFIAVELASSVTKRAKQLIEKLKTEGVDVNWVQPTQMHLTLKFLGNVADSEIPDICKVVAQATAEVEPFEIICRGLGGFPSSAEARTLWIGLEQGNDELRELQAAIDTALSNQLGFAKEQRGFTPHLTIGRVKGGTPEGMAAIATKLGELAQFDADLSVVEEAIIFASFLGRSGPTYEALAHCPLAD